MSKPIYNIYQCNKCLSMEYSYFDHSVHRWCMYHDARLEGMTCLTGNILCKFFKKAKKAKATYLRKEEYCRKYPE